MPTPFAELIEQMEQSRTRYNVAQRQARSASADSAPHLAACTRMDAAMAQMETAVRAWVAANPVEPPRPSPDHAAVYLDQHGNVWSDYPTVPPGDDVLPMVWAAEQAQSRAALADSGTELRIIGWCR